MICPNCSAPVALNTTRDSRTTPAGLIRRRRKCSECGHEWNTWETSQPIGVLTRHAERYRQVRDFIQRGKTEIEEEKAHPGD